MKIKAIEYSNFRNFKEPGRVTFSTDGKVTIIYGVNGAGKTTFHQLFQWIIYGTTHFNKTASDKMYNLDFERNASVNKQFSVIGSIDFEHAGDEYSIRREWIYHKSFFDTKKLSSSFTISKKVNDNDWIRLDNPTDIVEQLLPSGLSDYFFFDGESMITDLKAKGKDSAGSLKEALYLMLDLNIYAKAVDYIGDVDLKTTVLGSLFMDKIPQGSNSELKQYGMRMEAAQNTRDDLLSRIEVITEKIKEKKARIREISELIGSNAKSQRQYEQERQECKRRRDEYLRFAEREYEAFGQELVSVLPKQLIAKVVEKASLKIKHHADNAQLLPGINTTLVDSLAASPICICGRPLGDHEHDLIKELYKRLPPHGYDSIYQNFKDIAARWGKEFDRNRLEYIIKSAISDLEKARQCDADIVRIDKLMQEDKKYEALVVERKTAELDLEALEVQKLKLNGELTKASILVTKLQKEITKLTDSIESNKIIDDKIAIMQAVKSYYETILNDKSLLYSQKLEKTIQELLDIMLEARRTVTVSKDFALKVADSFDDESKSEGQFATVSFAYIGGIFKLLAEEEILHNKEYPLVLDAPFSKLGDAPRQKVVDTIPTYAPQIILLSKDNLQDCFAPEQIGKVYTILSNSEQNIATIEEGILWK